MSSSGSSASRAATSWENLRSVERIFDASVGTTSKDALEAFFDSMTRATADPGDLSLRRGMVRAAQDLGAYVSRDARVFQNTLADQSRSIQASMPELNELLTGVVLFQNDSVPSMLARISGILGP